MEWTLSNISEFSAESVQISPNGLGGWYIYVKYSWEAYAKAYDDYNFKSDTSAKSFFTKNFKSKTGAKPVWKNLIHS